MSDKKCKCARCCSETMQAKRIEEATSKLIELDTDQEFTPENVIRAIVEGFVPFVKWEG